MDKVLYKCSIQKRDGSWLNYRDILDYQLLEEGFLLVKFENRCVYIKQELIDVMDFFEMKNNES